MDVRYFPVGSVVRKETKRADGSTITKEIVNKDLLPVIMEYNEGGWKSIVIPQLAGDPHVKCSGKNACFIEQNRGYKCAIHRYAPNTI